MREPVGKFWSYFWDLKSYGGEWDRVSFTDFVTPKLARARACQQQVRVRVRVRVRARARDRARASPSPSPLTLIRTPPRP